MHLEFGKKRNTALCLDPKAAEKRYMEGTMHKDHSTPEDEFEDLKMKVEIMWDERHDKQVINDFVGRIFSRFKELIKIVLMPIAIAVITAYLTKYWQ